MGNGYIISILPKSWNDMTEFELIKKILHSQKIKRADVIIHAGDDGAVLQIPKDQQLVVSTDTLVSGTHFFPDMPAFELGYKALSVNLSDLAAMGALPAWAMLSLTLPRINDAWISKFIHGFFSLAEKYKIELIGGNLARGALSITVHTHGFIPKNQALTRSGAKPGDLIYVTGTLGDAAYGLSLLKKKSNHKNKKYFLSRLYRPTARIEVGIALRQLASSCIDISDGLISDLSHILENSKKGATLFLDKIPLSPQLRKEGREKMALQGGEDYELCFTISPKNQEKLKKINYPLTYIGKIEKEKKLIILDKKNKPLKISQRGYDHFHQRPSN